MKCKIVMLEKISEIKKITEQEMGDYFFRLSSTKQLKKANWDADDRTSAEPFYLLLQ